ncbi:glycosyltransferase [Dokdonella sp.]|mgnify:CR=1 FL=1|uniref:glycosyltransferase n=1 Tax=Dokdonella sp. TaxID=2291710 RepID=UPI0031BF5846|nr:glycosyltransferase [Dokdonella sp.]
MAELLRVLIVSDEMEVGGSQRQIAGLLRALPRAQCHVELAYFRNPSFLVDDIEQAGTTVHLVAKRRPIDLRFLHELVGFLRRGRFDVIHCFSLTAELWTALALRLAPGARMIASMRDMGHGLTPLQWRLKRRVCRQARAVISNSRGVADYLRAQIGAHPPQFVIANAVDPPAPLAAAEREALRLALGAQADRPLALFVGRLAHQKNVELLLGALAALAPAQRPQVALAGSGPLRADLEAQSRELGLERVVRFLGERRDAPALMQAADLLVLPSRDEGLSNVVIEAMAAGCPVLATRVGGNPELIEDQVSGILFDSGDGVALGAALAELCADAPRRQAMGEAARARVADRYSPERLARETLAVYRHCLEAA